MTTSGNVKDILKEVTKAFPYVKEKLAVNTKLFSINAGKMVLENLIDEVDPKEGSEWFVYNEAFMDKEMLKVLSDNKILYTAPVFCYYNVLTKNDLKSLSEFPEIMKGIETMTKKVMIPWSKIFKSLDN